MSLISEIEKVIYVTRDEMNQLTAEGYTIKVEDTIDVDILRVSFLAGEQEDAIIGLSFIRGVTKGYGNIHIMELIGVSPFRIHRQEVTFSTLIHMHHHAMEHLFRFAAENLKGQLFIYYTDEYQATVLDLLCGR